MRRDYPDRSRDCGTPASTELAKVRSVGSQSRSRLPKIVSLFAGAGGMDLGFKAVGFKIAFAVDAADAAIKTHKKNFPRTKSITDDLIKLKPAGVLKHIRAVVPEGERIAVIGGPPCQGFSRANTGSKADDPRNRLPSLYLKIVRELQRFYTVEFIVFENVLGIRDKKHTKTFASLIRGIKKLGFDVTQKELCAVDFGVPQNRRRIVLSGLREGQGYSKVIPRKRKGIATVRDAIGALPQPVFFERNLNPEKFGTHPNHWTMQPKSARFGKPAAPSGDCRSFKRLKWDLASPTIAFGHREIPVHPDGLRRLSIYEAMILQGFPTKFILKGNLSEQAEQISNAVPPPLARSVAAAVVRALDGR